MKFKLKTDPTSGKAKVSFQIKKNLRSNPLKNADSEEDEGETDVESAKKDEVDDVENSTSGEVIPMRFKVAKRYEMFRPDMLPDNKLIVEVPAVSIAPAAINPEAMDPSVKAAKEAAAAVSAVISLSEACDVGGALPIDASAVADDIFSTVTNTSSTNVLSTLESAQDVSRAVKLTSSSLKSTEPENELKKSDKPVGSSSPSAGLERRSSRRIQAREDDYKDEKKKDKEKARSRPEEEHTKERRQSSRYKDDYGSDKHRRINSDEKERSYRRTRSSRRSRSRSVSRERQRGHNKSPKRGRNGRQKGDSKNRSVTDYDRHDGINEMKSRSELEKTKTKMNPEREEKIVEEIEMESEYKVDNAECSSSKKDASMSSPQLTGDSETLLHPKSKQRDECFEGKEAIDETKKISPEKMDNKVITDFEKSVTPEILLKEIKRKKIENVKGQRDENSSHKDEGDQQLKDELSVKQKNKKSHIDSVLERKKKLESSSSSDEEASINDNEPPHSRSDRSKSDSLISGFKQETECRDQSVRGKNDSKPKQHHSSSNSSSPRHDVIRGKHKNNSPRRSRDIENTSPEKNIFKVGEVYLDISEIPGKSRWEMDDEEDKPQTSTFDSENRSRRREGRVTRWSDRVEESTKISVQEYDLKKEDKDNRSKGKSEKKAKKKKSKKDTDDDRKTSDISDIAMQLDNSEISKQRKPYVKVSNERMLESSPDRKKARKTQDNDSTHAEKQDDDSGRDWKPDGELSEKKPLEATNTGMPRNENVNSMKLIPDALSSNIGNSSGFEDFRNESGHKDMVTESRSSLSKSPIGRQEPYDRDSSNERSLRSGSKSSQQSLDRRKRSRSQERQIVSDSARKQRKRSESRERQHKKERSKSAERKKDSSGLLEGKKRSSQSIGKEKKQAHNKERSPSLSEELRKNPSRSPDRKRKLHSRSRSPDRRRRDRSRSYSPDKRRGYRRRSRSSDRRDSYTRWSQTSHSNRYRRRSRSRSLSRDRRIRDQRDRSKSRERYNTNRYQTDRYRGRQKAKERIRSSSSDSSDSGSGREEKNHSSSEKKLTKDLKTKQKENVSSQKVDSGYVAALEASKYSMDMRSSAIENIKTIGKVKPQKSQSKSEDNLILEDMDISSEEKDGSNRKKENTKDILCEKGKDRQKTNDRAKVVNKSASEPGLSQQKQSVESKGENMQIKFSVAGSSRRLNLTIKSNLFDDKDDCNSAGLQKKDFPCGLSDEEIDKKDVLNKMAGDEKIVAESSSSADITEQDSTFVSREDDEVKLKESKGMTDLTQLMKHNEDFGERTSDIITKQDDPTENELDKNKIEEQEEVKDISPPKRLKFKYIPLWEMEGEERPSAHDSSARDTEKSFTSGLGLDYSSYSSDDEEEADKPLLANDNLEQLKSEEPERQVYNKLEGAKRLEVSKQQNLKHTKTVDGDDAQVVLKEKEIEKSKKKKKEGDTNTKTISKMSLVSQSSPNPPKSLECEVYSPSHPSLEGDSETLESAFHATEILSPLYEETISDETFNLMPGKSVMRSSSEDLREDKIVSVSEDTAVQTTISRSVQDLSCASNSLRLSPPTTVSLTDIPILITSLPSLSNNLSVSTSETVSPSVEGGKVMASTNKNDQTSLPFPFLNPSQDTNTKIAKSDRHIEPLRDANHKSDNSVYITFQPDISTCEAAVKPDFSKLNNSPKIEPTITSNREQEGSQPDKFAASERKESPKPPKEHIYNSSTNIHGLWPGKSVPVNKESPKSPKESIYDSDAIFDKIDLSQIPMPSDVGLPSISKVKAISTKYSKVPTPVINPSESPTPPLPPTSCHASSSAPLPPLPPELPENPVPPPPPASTTDNPVSPLMTKAQLDNTPVSAANTPNSDSLDRKKRFSQSPLAIGMLPKVHTQSPLAIGMLPKIISQPVSKVHETDTRHNRKAQLSSVVDVGIVKGTESSIVNKPANESSASSKSQPRFHFVFKNKASVSKTVASAFGDDDSDSDGQSVGEKRILAESSQDLAISAVESLASKSDKSSNVLADSLTGFSEDNLLKDIYTRHTSNPVQSGIDINPATVMTSSQDESLHITATNTEKSSRMETVHAQLEQISVVCESPNGKHSDNLSEDCRQESYRHSNDVGKRDSKSHQRTKRQEDDMNEDPTTKKIKEEKEDDYGDGNKVKSHGGDNERRRSGRDGEDKARKKSRLDHDDGHRRRSGGSFDHDEKDERKHRHSSRKSQDRSRDRGKDSRGRDRRSRERDRSRERRRSRERGRSRDYDRDQSWRSKPSRSSSGHLKRRSRDRSRSHSLSPGYRRNRSRSRERYVRSLSSDQDSDRSRSRSVDRKRHSEKSHFKKRSSKSFKEEIMEELGKMDAAKASASESDFFKTAPIVVSEQSIPTTYYGDNQQTSYSHSNQTYQHPNAASDIFTGMHDTSYHLQPPPATPDLSAAGYHLSDPNYVGQYSQSYDHQMYGASQWPVPPVSHEHPYHSALIQNSGMHGEPQAYSQPPPSQPIMTSYQQQQTQTHMTPLPSHPQPAPTQPMPIPQPNEQQYPLSQGIPPPISTIPLPAASENFQPVHPIGQKYPSQAGATGSVRVTIPELPSSLAQQDQFQIVAPISTTYVPPSSFDHTDIDRPLISSQKPLLNLGSTSVSSTTTNFVNPNLATIELKTSSSILASLNASKPESKRTRKSRFSSITDSPKGSPYVSGDLGIQDSPTTTTSVAASSVKSEVTSLKDGPMFENSPHAEKSEEYSSNTQGLMSKSRVKSKSEKRIGSKKDKPWPEDVAEAMVSSTGVEDSQGDTGSDSGLEPSLRPLKVRIC